MDEISESPCCEKETSNADWADRLKQIFTIYASKIAMEQAQIAPTND